MSSDHTHPTSLRPGQTLEPKQRQPSPEERSGQANGEALQTVHSHHSTNERNRYTSSTSSETDDGRPLGQALLRALELRPLLLQLVAVLLHLLLVAFGPRVLLSVRREDVRGSAELVREQRDDSLE
jgi:hypothetical protein